MKKLSRRGLPVYDKNPSIEKAMENQKIGYKKISSMHGEMIIANSSTGEILSGVNVGFHKKYEIEKNQFIKLYADGVKAFIGLTTGGAKLLEIVISETSKSKDQDKIYLSAYRIQTEWGVAERTYMRAIKELLKKEILFEHIEQNWYFINVNYIFNGNRMAFLKTYEIIDSNSETSEHPNQAKLSL